MHDIIPDSGKDPLGTMLLDYLGGCSHACMEVNSTIFAMDAMSAATMFRTYADMPYLEQLALDLCTGRILDVGAGSGCHTLYLQRQGRDVLAVDISPGCVQAMRRQNVHHVRHCNLFSLADEKFNTILMLMNGLGLCGTLDGINLFFQFAETLLYAGGQILVDSTDLRSLFEQAEDFSADAKDCVAETSFVMRYRDVSSDPFDWVYVDYATLETLAVIHGFQCRRLYADSRGCFLARIFT